MRRPARPLLAALLALLLLLGACGGGDGGGASDEAAERRDGAGAPSDAADEGGAAVEDAEASDGAKSDVQLVDAGKEPRKELRFSFEEGRTFRSRMTMELGLEMSIDGQSMPSPALPPMELLIAGRIEKVARGVATYSFTYERVGVVATEGVDPAVASQYEAALQGMQGLRGTGSIDEQGKAGESTLDTSEITDPNLRSTLDSVTAQISGMTVPFPRDAVGVGATWKADRRTVINGITTDASSTYTLRSRDGDRYVLDVVQQVTAPAGKVDIPGLAAGQAEIVDYRMTNEGEITGDLSKVLPTASAVAGGGDIRMKVSDAGRTADLVQKLSLDVRFADA